MNYPENVIISDNFLMEKKMKKKIAFIGATDSELRFIKFFSLLPDFEIALVSEERKNSSGIKFAEEKQYRTSSSFIEVLKIQDIDIIAVLTPNPEIFSQIYNTAKPHQTVLDRKHFIFFYETMASLISTKYLTIEENFNQNTKEIKRAISDFSLITKNIDILAINASIEAARAGESGKGFAVVASNIKNLVKSSRDMLVHIKSVLDKFTILNSQLMEIRESLIEKKNENDQ